MIVVLIDLLLRSFYESQRLAQVTSVVPRALRSIFLFRVEGSSIFLFGFVPLFYFLLNVSHNFLVFLQILVVFDVSTFAGTSLFIEL